MAKSAHLGVKDVRAILQLVGECRDLGDDPGAWQQHLFQTVAQLTGSSLVTCGDFADLPAGRAVVLNSNCWWEN